MIWTHCVFQLIGAVTGHIFALKIQARKTKYINISVFPFPYRSVTEALKELLAKKKKNHLISPNHARTQQQL